MSSVKESTYIEDVVGMETFSFIKCLNDDFKIDVSELDKSFYSKFNQIINQVEINDLIKSARNNKSIINSFIKEKNTYNNQLFSAFSVLKIAYAKSNS
ncbi:hypothetical protein [Paenibacillus xylanexedens]|uniref:hypothetical protein n=1 Tax=Paenibacillus xylanexedens TaxID=528191 RepID=UPI000F5294B7|nr:hypothetical protein [Paenibacillus xylanexedens]